MSDWTPERDALARIEDLLAHLVAVTVAVGGGKPGNVRVAKRPTTAVDKMRKAQRREKHQQLVARVLTSPGDPAPAP